jgi:phosphoribosylaminoimidazolecarboxamide formyltransferase / IMP cyclohydrolase
MTVNIVSEIDQWVGIRTALISVSDKRGLEVLVPGLLSVNSGLRILSTGGTYSRIAELLGPKDAQTHLVQVSDYTGQPETQGGLVKTLDYKIYLGLLTETYNEAHQKDLARVKAAPIDLVAVNLYPFQETVAKPGTTLEEARANIDIGGPCMLRAAAKNYLRVTTLCDPADYPMVIKKLRIHGGRLDLATRFSLGKKAFFHTAAYDATISQYFEQTNIEGADLCYQKKDLMK